MAVPTLLVFRTTLFETSSSQTPANDILQMMQAQENDGKGISLIKVGNGSDSNFYSLVNEFYFY